MFYIKQMKSESKGAPIRREDGENSFLLPNRHAAGRPFHRDVHKANGADDKQKKRGLSKKTANYHPKKEWEI